MVSDVQAKISANAFNTPATERVAPQEFLFLTCLNSDSYLRESRELLPAIYPLICQLGEDGTTATLVPWDNQDKTNQGPAANPEWLKCIEPKYCSNFPVPPVVTTVAPATTLTPEDTTLPPPTPSSVLVRLDAKLKTGTACGTSEFCVREYDVVEYKCEDDDMVAEWASTFEVICNPSGLFIAPDVWPICRPSIKCQGAVPVAPFYTNLVTVNTPPVKEYDKVEYTCYDETMKIVNNSKVIPKFEIECDSDTKYKPATKWQDWNYKWPICQLESRKKCSCLGDPDITDSAVCSPPPAGTNATVCPAKVLLDTVCRNYSKFEIMSNQHIPLKDRCGTYDPTNPTKENMCYCQQRENEGVKDAYIMDFHITSELWDKQMAFATTEVFQDLKLRVEANIDNMLLSNSYFSSRGFTRTVVMKVAQGPGLKCRNPPQPPASVGYVRVTDINADVEIGESYYFECIRSKWRASDNHTDPFGYVCRPDQANAAGPVGQYGNLPNATELWEPCTRDPSYVDGCKAMDRLDPEGKGKDTGLYISPFNPDNVLIGDYLEYVCPENPEISGQFMVADMAETFKVKCISDGLFEELKATEWPACRPPGTCLAGAGPPVPESTAGLSNTYSDKLEFQNITFQCTDSIKEPVGSTVVTREANGAPIKVVEILCGIGPNWTTPLEWPVCTFKDEFSCDPNTELTIPDWTGLIPENTKFILYDTMVSTN